MVRVPKRPGRPERTRRLGGRGARCGTVRPGAGPPPAGARVPPPSGYPRGRVPGVARRMRGVRARNSPWRLQWTRIVPLPRMGKRAWASCSG